jgi:SAM-dependent methyltransferase
VRRPVKIKFGFCPCCGKATVFVAFGHWFRDDYKCARCKSIPRQRAIMSVLADRCGDWENLSIHESSPCGPTFDRMKRDCANYSYSYFYPEKKLGEVIGGGGKVTNQNLQEMTFLDSSFDLFITQDVFEHLNEPEKALKEIFRCLKPGGKHVFTVPIYPFLQTRPRIKMENGHIVPIMEEQYHRNPISEKGSLVTYDWGGDIGRVIDSMAGFKTEIIEFQDSRENHRMGLEADFLQVVVSTKL